ncbi:flavin-containing monooxygenase [Hoyosella subflava]|uniref:Putative monooxygenase n=1 Tax=Hoyosella subflava (strain DSM 45089 / JCM 17490 / NBRC 109087 / DQS3-9A1) TaxID=443218 RepID=F6EL82_HOYSD|nr:NAD(P)/FAD-dependent oxidoreductase [Hoyosella subflava]AEF39174.1 Putative monooxygenase [Hoyosella subflava DQS3-9A1]
MARGETQNTASPSVIIVGAGFGGLGMAMELQRAGFNDFTILERADDVGGVWRENTYPGAGCDIPSPLYSYSFEPKSDWPKRFSLQPDILEYMRGVARKRGLFNHIRFGTEVSEAEFSEDTGQWTVRVSGGTELTADVVIMAAGQLSRPSMPRIPGIEKFEGQSFHSAEWDHSVSLEGKRVAVVGTGASAVQFVPAIAPDVAHLTLFQRSAAWVLPKPDVEYKPWHHTVLKRIPPVRLAERLGFWALCEFLSLGLVDIPAIQPMVVRIAENHLRNQVPDPELRAKLTPDYPAGCKRGLFSNDYFPALTRPNVTVETTGIREVTETGVVTEDGVHHEADVIIYGTGFKGTEFLWPMKIFGAGRQALQDVWGPKGARAYLGMAIPEFPNLFVMYGPNTNLGVGSIVYMIESQARYIRQAVEVLARRPGQYLSVRPDVEEAFDEKLQKRLDRSPWNFCSSWYRNAAGRITNNWPGTVSSYRRKTRRLKLDDYHLVSARKGS